MEKVANNQIFTHHRFLETCEVEATIANIEETLKHIILFKRAEGRCGLRISKELKQKHPKEYHSGSLCIGRGQFDKQGSV